MGPIDDRKIPKKIRDFVYRFIDSVELVRVLLLLESDPSRKWSVDELSAELRSSPLGIEKRLEDLYSRRILRKDSGSGRHSFVPWDDSVRELVHELSQFDKKYPYGLIDLIYSRREGALRDFSDAFTFKKDKDE